MGAGELVAKPKEGVVERSVARDQAQPNNAAEAALPQGPPRIKIDVCTLQAEKD